MKLIDVLVRELPKYGGWPVGVGDIEMLSDGTIYFDGDEAPDSFKLTQCEDGWSRLKSARDYSNAVTREQYEAALAASKTEWDGYGLPPVGVECEFKANDGSWGIGTVLCVGKNRIFWLCHEDGDEYTSEVSPREFRPIRSEADKKKEDVEKSIADALFRDGDFAYVEALRLSTFVYGAISRNEIPHIRID